MSICSKCKHGNADGSAFCGQCGQRLAGGEAVTQTGVVSPSPTPRSASPRTFQGSRTSGAGRLSLSDTTEPSRFAPAEMIADRYRIIGLVGKGGMGEVYRADDIKLGQAVALKFLPAELANDEVRLARFLDEVRVSRQVSHPNVCRVYDIGEHDGHHYISMEYVDGEDLASLIRRIGRLSEDKANEIARQICAGLSAAHAKGIVHRDLKPSNVMIDGRGQVRITDFGLAGLAEGFEGAEIRVGTPAYMSPEQIAGTEVTVRSDIYSLGLVLYELFTGKAVFVGKTVADLSRQHLEAVPSTPSTVVPGFDPRIDRVILRCLEKDPSQRPATALAVVGALPGGDPLAAALEAGETPSPEMIAAAGDSDAMNPGVAFGMLALILLGVAAMFALSPDYQALALFEADKPPAALVFDSRELIRTVGYEGEPADRTFGFGVDGSYERHVKKESREADRWDDYGQVRPSPIVFWYRQSPRPLVPTRGTGSASFSNPPMAISGMVRVQTDLHGRLQYFDALPPQKGHGDGASADWRPLLDAAQLDPALLDPAEPEWNPLIDCDVRLAWTGSYPGQPDVPIRIEAGSFSGVPVYFDVIAPWTIPSRMQETTQAQAHVGNIIALTLISVLLGGGVLLARANLKRGRGDKRGAFVMAGYLFVVLLAQWVLQVHHVKSFAELGMFADALQTGLLIGAVVWVIYVALEPYARRQWPHAMITWSRLLTGRFRDPLIGRDLLIGSLTGVAVSLLILLGGLIPGWLGRPGPDPVTNSVGTLGGLNKVAGIMFGLQPGAMIVPIAIFFLIFGVRLVVRKQWAAVGVAFVLMSLVQGLQTQQTTVLGWAASAVVWGILIFVIVRFGILSALISFVYANTLLVLPLTTDLSAWYVNRAWFGLAVLAIVTGTGVYLALAGRPVFAGALLQDA